MEHWIDEETSFSQELGGMPEILPRHHVVVEGLGLRSLGPKTGNQALSTNQGTMQTSWLLSELWRKDGWMDR